MDFKVTNSFSRENLNYKNGNVKNIHYGDIHTKFQTLFDITKEKVPFINEEISLNRISDENYCKEGDIVFADASEDLTDVGKSIEIINLNNEKLLSGLHTLLARPKESKNYKGFNGYLFKSNNIRTQIQKEAQGSKVLSINVGRINKIELAYPSFSEQEKITSFLNLIDNRICTQSKIITELESLILGLKTKLFSMQLRFSGFEDEWGNYKIADLFEYFATNSLSWEQLEYQEGNIYNLHYGLIHKAVSSMIDMEVCELPQIKNDITLKNYTLCKDGDIAFADASEDTKDVAKVVEFLNCNDKEVVCGLHTIHARDKLNLTVKGFKGYAFSSILFRHQIQQLAQGTKIFSISPKILNECYIKIPSNKEQLKIVNLLSLIDKKIEIERKFLSQYETQKKYLIANLFI